MGSRSDIELHLCHFGMGSNNSIMPLCFHTYFMLTFLQYPNYHEVISNPMDLHTVKQKIKTGKFDSLDDFAKDVRLIFSNCLKYHKRHSPIGKAGVSLKAFFEKRCADLGLSDLGLMEGEKSQSRVQNKPGRRSARQK